MPNSNHRLWLHLAPKLIDTSPRLFAEALSLLLFGRQWPDTPQKALHERNARDEDETRANSREDHVRRHRSPFQARRSATIAAGIASGGNGGHEGHETTGTAALVIRMQT